MNTGLQRGDLNRRLLRCRSVRLILFEEVEVVLESEGEEEEEGAEEEPRRSRRRRIPRIFDQFLDF